MNLDLGKASVRRPPGKPATRSPLDRGAFSCTDSGGSKAKFWLSQISKCKGWNFPSQE